MKRIAESLREAIIFTITADCYFHAPRIGRDGRADECAQIARLVVIQLGLDIVLGVIVQSQDGGGAAFASWFQGVVERMIVRVMGNR